MTTLDKISQDLRDLLSSISDPEIKEAVAKDFISFIDTLEPKGKSDYINQMLKGDCLEVMKGIPGGSVDMILCDLPYGTTRNSWDVIIPLEPLWEQYKRIIKANGAIVLTAQTPFDKVLGSSNLEWLRYEWIWSKPQGTGHLNAKKFPMKSHENILVFCKGLHNYNPQMRVGKPYKYKQGSKSQNYDISYQSQVITESDGERYPLTVININREKQKLHPTQKPVTLFEYLIKTYTNEGDVVLDNCSGSGTTAIAALNTGRKFICIEKDDKYHAIGVNRVKGWYEVNQPSSDKVMV